MMMKSTEFASTVQPQHRSRYDPEFLVSPPPLEVATLRLTFCLEDPATLPEWKGQWLSLIRGRLGPLLMERECSTECAPLDKECVRGGICTFLSVFNPPKRSSEWLLEQGVEMPPPPYALFPPLDKRTEYHPGDTLTMRLTLIGKGMDHAYSLLHSIWQALERPLRVKASTARYTLMAIESVDPLGGPPLPIPLSLLHGSGTHLRPWLQATTGAHLLVRAMSVPDRLTIHFKSPMSLKKGGQFTRVPDCPLLVERLRFRMSLLSYLYGGGLWPMAAESVSRATLQDMAVRVRTEDRKVEWLDWSRTKSDSRISTPMGGFVGYATYGNVPLALRLLLLAGSVVQVGDNVVFGNGAYRVEPAIQ